MDWNKRFFDLSLDQKNEVNKGKFLFQVPPLIIYLTNRRITVPPVSHLLRPYLRMLIYCY
jgi:hypothetical protein